MEAIKFEVFGKVQGVFFRKHTQKTALSLSIKGWVQNTAEGTVIGEAEGPTQSMSSFKLWLRNTGSPKSRIDKCNISTIEPKNHSGFVISK